MFQWVCHANDVGLLMCYFEQDHPSFYDSSESQLELFTCDLFQLQLYKTSESITVTDLHLVSIQEVKKTFSHNFFDLS